MVGAVSELYQGDLHFGRTVVERLEAEGGLGDVRCEQFDYGAVAVVQRLEELRPDVLVLVAAVERGRAPGGLYRRLLEPLALTRAAAGRAVAEAATGYIRLDLVHEVASALGALPPYTVAIELEPVEGGPSTELSPLARAAVAPALERIRSELTLAPGLPGPAGAPPPAAPPPSR